MIDTDGLPAAVAASQVAFSFTIDDLTAHAEEQIQQRGLSIRALLPLLHLQWLRRRPDTATLLRSWLSLYRDLLRAPGGRPIALRLTWYVAAVSERSPDELRGVYRELGPVMEKHYMSTADQILSRGWREGMHKGMQQGMQEGIARTLSQLLERRFGALDDATLTRIHTASLDDLERFTSRLLTAPTLAAVLEP